MINNFAKRYYDNIRSNSYVKTSEIQINFTGDSYNSYDSTNNIAIVLTAMQPHQR